MKYRIFFSLLGLLCLPWFTGCTARVYVIDQHTLLENEAAGEWPDFEKDILDKSKQAGPLPLPKTEMNEERRHLYHVLNGELLSADLSGGK